MQHKDLMVAAMMAAFALALTGGVAAQEAAHAPAAARPAATRDTTTDPQPAATRDTVTDAMIDAGREVFHGPGTCFACHGQELEGTGVAPSLKDDKWLVADGSYASILKVIQGGVNGTAMQAHPGGISDKMARNVAAYVWAQSHPDAKLSAAQPAAAHDTITDPKPAVTRDTITDPKPAAARDEITDAMIDAGREVFHGPGTCFACHGQKLEGTGVAPSLTDDKWLVADGSYASILKVIQGGVNGTAMQAHPGGISDEMAKNVAAYVWALSKGKAKL